MSAGELTPAAAGPVICAVVLLGVLSAWFASGGAGTLTRVRFQIIEAAVPTRSFTSQATAAVSTAHTHTYLTIRNLSGSPEELIAASSPIGRHTVLTGRLTIPADGTLVLSPFGGDAVLADLR